MRNASEFMVADVAAAAKVDIKTARRWARQAGMGHLNERGHLALTEKEYQILSRRQKMSSRQSGAKGGAVTRSRFGPDHYCLIGQCGGETTVDRYGSKFFQTLGQKGGTATRERHGPEHYIEMGKRGGSRTR
jgi:general stress protein YciG